MITTVAIFENAKGAMQWLSAFRSDILKLGVDTTELKNKLDNINDGLGDTVLYKEFGDVDVMAASMATDVNAKLLTDKETVAVCKKWLKSVAQKNTVS